MTDSNTSRRLDAIERQIENILQAIDANTNSIDSHTRSMENLLNGSIMLGKTDEEQGKRIDHLVENYNNLATRHAGMVQQLRDLRDTVHRIDKENKRGPGA